MNPSIEIVPIELAGHGSRIGQPLYEDVQKAAVDISNHIQNKRLPDCSYAILGHSLGSLLAYETYYELKKRDAKLPLHMFFTGGQPPQGREGNKTSHLLPDDAFLAHVYGYGATSREFMENKELQQLFLPILKNDFKLTETYKYQPKQNKIQCDITIVNGNEDLSIRDYDMNIWEDCTSSNASIQWMHGNHFFLFQDKKSFVDIINNRLMEYVHK